MYLINPYRYAAYSGIAFNPADSQTARVALSNNNKTATRTIAGGTPGLARATVSKSSGKWYTEIVCNSPGASGGELGVGLSTSGLLTTAGANNYLGGLTSSGGPSLGYWATGLRYYDGGAQSGLLAFTTGDVIMVAVDIPTGVLWYGKNGTWGTDMGGNVGDPGAGLYPTVGPPGLLTGLTLFPTIDCYGTDAAGTIRSAPEYGYSVPSGFSAWG